MGWWRRGWEQSRNLLQASNSQESEAAGGEAFGQKFRQVDTGEGFNEPAQTEETQQRDPDRNRPRRREDLHDDPR